MSETTINVIAQANLISFIASSLVAVLLTMFGIWSFRIVKSHYSNAILLFAIQFIGLLAIFVVTVFTSLFAFDQIYRPYVIELVKLSTDTNAFISSKYGFVPLWDAGPRGEINLVNAGIIILVCAVSFLKTWIDRKIQRKANA